MVPLLFLIGCIERVTDVAVPLDPAFYEGGGGDASTPAGASMSLGIPWDGDTSSKTDVKFQIGPQGAGAIQLDVIVPDKSAAGGVKRIGRIESDEPGITLSVPSAVTAFTIEVFQDPGSDGPSTDDPYATMDLDMSKLPEQPIALPLVVGARPAPGGGGGGVSEPWAGYAGETVQFTGEIATTSSGDIQVDFAEFDASAPGGQKRVGQLRLPQAGAFTVDVPTNVAKFRIEAFQDVEGDGPTQSDPYAELTVEVGKITADPASMTLVPGSRGAPGSGGNGQPDGAPGGPGGGGPGGAGEAPWSSWTGETITFNAKVVTPAAGPVQVDVAESDPTAQGGQKRVGQVHLEGSGVISFKVPTDVESFRVEAFQDPDHDGPSESDPYAELTVSTSTIGDPPTLTLVAGARGRPDGPGAGEGTPAAPPPGEGSPSLGSGPKVKISGKVTASRDLPVKIDLFKIDAATASGRTYLFKVSAVAGAWSAELPANLGPIVVEAYQDVAGDGPTGDDPKAAYSGALVVADSPLANVDLALP